MDIIDKKVQLFENASKIARQSFRFLWREQFWNFRRSEAKCDYVAVMCAVSDEVDGVKQSEQFWLVDPIFDGVYVYGTVAVIPSVIKNLEKGAVCTVPVDRIEDWMYVKEGKVYGGYTVNLRRSFLKGGELAMFDQGWGYDFGSPLTVDRYPKAVVAKVEEVVKKKPPTKLFGITLGKTQAPMSAAAAEELEEDEVPHIDYELDHPDALARFENYSNLFRAHPEKVNELDENGFSPLHNHALAGNWHVVEVLLACGANTSLKTAHGHTARDLAMITGWVKVVELLPV